MKESSKNWAVIALIICIIIGFFTRCAAPDEIQSTCRLDLETMLEMAYPGILVTICKEDEGWEVELFCVNKWEEEDGKQPYLEGWAYSSNDHPTQTAYEAYEIGKKVILSKLDSMPPMLE